MPLLRSLVVAFPGSWRRMWIALRAIMLLSLPLCGCVQQANVPDLHEAEGIGRGFGYHAVDTGRAPGLERALPNTYVVLAFSGGGTRAAAFAHGALRELGATRSPAAPDLTLLEAVDMVSSTSGGSVAAANFVLRGREGYRMLDQPNGFLRQNGMADLIAGVLDPFDIADRTFTSKSRVQLLSAWFRSSVFGETTFETLLTQKPRRPPLLVLNSADMASGERFPFVQRQLDRLCLDLREIKLADAVAASAAFPIALTPMRLPNRSPCRAQSSGRGARVIDGYLNEAGSNRAELAEHCHGGPVLNMDPSTFRTRGRRQFPLLNLDDCGQPRAANDPARIRYVHLLDGGIADNVGLAEPLETLTVQGDDDRVVSAIVSGHVREVVVIAVNARSQPSTTIGRDSGTPGILSMALGVTSAAIDGRSGGLFAQLDTLSDLLGKEFRQRPPKVTVLPVDFELIQDGPCRAAFQKIGTNWSLSENEVTALQEMASAILRASPDYLKLAGASSPADASVGQARALRACQRLAKRFDGTATFGP